MPVKKYLLELEPEFYERFKKALLVESAERGVKLTVKQKILELMAEYTAKMELKNQMPLFDQISKTKRRKG